MRFLKLLLYVSLLVYGLPKQQFYLSSAHDTKLDQRLTKLQVFLARTPLAGESATFLHVADKNGLDWRLLPAVACLESSCGKHYLYNAFGWGSDRIDFGTDASDISGVAHGIATLSYYKQYKRSGDTNDFCMAYNGPNAVPYCAKLKAMMERI
jgi:hypothetical protein